MRPLCFSGCLECHSNLAQRFTSSKPREYAEFVAVPLPNLIVLPDSISFENAAAFPLVFLTAWHMIVGRAQLKAGEDVLVWAAGSGVGMAAIQIAVGTEQRVSSQTPLSQP